MLVVLWCTYFFPHLVGISILSKTIINTTRRCGSVCLGIDVLGVCEDFYVNEECVSSALQQLVEMRGMEGETQYWSYIGRELVR